jgi:hypothetical protein
MSLLDDVSIVVTPNGYKAGELYAVIPVPSEGAEEVVNGDFATDSAWTKSPSGVTISGGSANFNLASDTYIYQDILTEGKTYKITFSGTINSGSFYIGQIGVFNNVFSAGTYTDEVVYLSVSNLLGGYRFIIRKFGAGTLDATIDNVSVKEYTSADMDVTRATAATRVDEDGLVNYAEVIGSEEVTNGDFATDSDWSKGTGWSISGGTAILDGTQTGGSSLSSSNMTVTVGKIYKVTVNVSATSSGFRLYDALGVVSYGLSLGENIFYRTPSSSTYTLTPLGLGGATGTISNVSVKEAARDNVPRIDYTGGGCPHILAEPQRTNLLPYSEDLSQWNLKQAAATLNYGISPDGTQNSTRIVFASSNLQFSNIFTTVTPTTGSIYIKGVNGETINFGLDSSENVFTLNGSWQRFEKSGTSTSNKITINTFGGATARDIQVWGAQVEEGSYATSYIPTSGSTVTRNQDIFTRDGIGSLINSTEGVLFVEIASLSESGNYRELGLSDGTTSNRVLISYKSTDNVIRGSFQGSGGANLEYTVTSSKDFHKIAVKWKVNDFALWVDGVEVGSDTSGSSFPADTLNSLALDDGGGASKFFGKVKQLQVYDTALTDTQLAALTS